MASDLSSASQLAGVVSDSVTKALGSTAFSVPSLVSDATTDAAQQPGSWLGFFGWLVWFILHVVSTILYWAIRITTFSLPSFLFTLFSTSWTVTMNATTLYASLVVLK